MAVARLRVTEIIRPTSSGETRPFQCRLEDDQMYAVKGRAAFQYGLCAELISALLAKAVDLPVPDFVIAVVPPLLIQSSPIPGVLHSLGAGPAFGSKWHDGAKPVSPAVRDRADAKLLATLYAFDHWIGNGDRSLGDDAGNPNLLVNLAEDELIVFDHNLAFFDLTYGVQDLPGHIGSRCWRALKGDSDFRHDLLVKFAKALNDFDSFTDELPDEWLDERPDLPQIMQERLHRINTEAFWAELG